MATMHAEPMFSLAGRRALITGSSRGIGRAIGLGMVEAGARVAFHGVTQSETLAATVAEAGDTCVAVTGDLGAPEGPDTIAADAVAALGGIDILVLNASVEIREPWQEITHEAFQRQIAVNMESAVRLIAALTPAMVAAGWGRVLAIGSVQEVKERPPMLVYGAIKAAQTSMMRNLARELAPSGVTFNTLSPGVIDTDRTSDVLADPTFAATMRSRVPMQSFGEPEDCVGAAIFLCSRAGRYVTGIRLMVDGGMHL